MESRNRPLPRQGDASHGAPGNLRHFQERSVLPLEWIAYHRAIGFDHIVLYDNASTDGGAALIRSSWAASCTTVIP
ncbi:MAG: glycosyltransferase family 2 protein [Proteobacteria bacterium]|nr:glycosyltransferase family 2 protein [Pseudomonadota bacterium]